MGLGNRYGSKCDADTIATANKYLGTSYDTIKAVYDHLAAIEVVAELGEMNRGLQGNTPDVVDNGDGSYTISGNNGDITVSDGFSPTITDTSGGVLITDGSGNQLLIANGLSRLMLPAYITTNVVPSTPVGGTYDGSTLTPPTGYTDTPVTSGVGEVIWVTYALVVQIEFGAWTVSTWSPPAKLSGYTPVKGVDYFDGATGQLHVYVFRNATSVPTTPSNGTYDNGVNVPPTNWTNDSSTPAAGEVVWVSHTVYSQDNTGNWSFSSWSVPGQLSGYTPVKGLDYDDGTDARHVSWIYTTQATLPVRPVGGSWDGTTEVIPAGWSDDLTLPANDTESVYQSTLTYTHDGTNYNPSGVWSLPLVISGANGFTPVKGVDYFDGLTGNFRSSVFRLSTNAPATPAGGTFDGTNEVAPTGWNDNPTTATGGLSIWVSQAVYKASNTGSWTNAGWSAPVQFNGRDSRAFYESIIYINSVNAPTRPGDAEGSYDGTNESYPTGWDIDLVPLGTDESTYVTKTTYTQADDNTWSHTIWSLPVLFNSDSGLSQQIDILNTDVDSLISDVIWNTVKSTGAISTGGYNFASITETNIVLANETVARVEQGVQLTASIEGSSDAVITRLDVVEAQADGTATAFSVVQGKVDSPSTGLSASYQLAQSAKTGSDDNATAITSLSTTVGDGTSGLVLSVTQQGNDISTLVGRASLSVNSAGRVTGVFINGSASESNMALQADKITFVTPTGVTKLSWTNNDLLFTGTMRIDTADLTATNTLNTNTTKTDVGLANVDNSSNSTIRAVAAATSGTVAGWTLNSVAIYSGTYQAANAYTTSGITLHKDGAIRAKNFRIDTGGSAYFKGVLEAATGNFGINGQVVIGGSFTAGIGGTNTFAVGMNSSTSGGVYAKASGYAIQGVCSGSGVAGFFTATESFGQGVLGQAVGTQGIGVFGRAYIAARAGGQFERLTQTVYVAYEFGGTTYGISVSQGSTHGVYSRGGSYDFYAAGTGVNYGPFTGGHDGLIPIDSPLFEAGDIVCDVKVVHKAGISNAICEIAQSTKANQKGVIGALVWRDTMNPTDLPAALDYSIQEHVLLTDTYDLVAFNAVGEGLLNVCGEGGDFEIGDLIVTSSIPGKGMKQADDLVRSITVAKIRENVSFKYTTEIRQVAVIYMCG